MGNLMFAFGSKFLDMIGFGIEGREDKEENGSCQCIPYEHTHFRRRTLVEIRALESYCKRLIFVKFQGQTSNFHTDRNSEAEIFNLGVYLQALDRLIRMVDPSEFSADEPIFLNLLQKVADKRNSDESQKEQFYEKIVSDAKSFEKIYKAREEKLKFADELEHDEYWGTRQQLLSGKVTCDWLCEDGMIPMDPIFGVLLNPTAGRVGPGDSDWVHNLLYDNCGEWAHHSAVHDAFGYLLNYHGVGPGYNYMYKCLLDKTNPLSGQISGIDFWKKYIKEVEIKLKVIENFKAE